MKEWQKFNAFNANVSGISATREKFLARVTFVPSLSANKTARPRGNFKVTLVANNKKNIGNASRAILRNTRLSDLVVNNRAKNRDTES